MTPTQIKYLSERMRSIRSNKLSKVPYGPSEEQYDEWYRNDNYTVEKKNGNYVIVWTLKDTDVNKKLREKIEADYTRIMDQIMIGDASTIAYLIREFEAND